MREPVHEPSLERIVGSWVTTTAIHEDRDYDGHEDRSAPAKAESEWDEWGHAIEHETA